jgi:RNA polymerase sigma factor (sigma-70 family)
MFAIAYRMLGSATEAEDVLQEAWLRWQGTDRAAVHESGAFLARVVTNLCLNALGSARVRREVYVGPWLPEPVFTSSIAPGPAEHLGPLDDVTQRESVSFALLTLLERLTPTERAAYVLREAFGYSHREVADLIGTTEANVRQLHARGRRHLAAEPVRPVDPARWRELVGRFLAAAREGDLAGLETLLADDVMTRADGGGVVNAARRPVVGPAKVARHLIGVLNRFTEGVTAHIAEVNGQLAIVGTAGAELRAIWFLGFDDGRLSSLDMVLNPEKLAFAARQLSRNGEAFGLSS